MLEIFTRAFYQKSLLELHPWSSICTWNHQKDGSHLKKIKILHMARDTMKTLKRRKNEKQKVSENFNNLTTTTKFFTFIFGPASARFYKIGVAGNNWLVGWFVTQFSQKRL